MDLIIASRPLKGDRYEVADEKPILSLFRRVANNLDARLRKTADVFTARRAAMASWRRRHAEKVAVLHDPRNADSQDARLWARHAMFKPAHRSRPGSSNVRPNL